MKHPAVFFLFAAIFFFIIIFSNAFADEIEVAPGIKATDPSNTGAAVLRVPIEVPPGRNGIAPNIALSYNSGSGYGWVGMGWNLEPGAIQRSTKNGVNYNANDFIFLKDDASLELVSRGDLGTNYYGNKIEGAFTKYHYDAATGWEVTTKDGLKYYYGTTTASRQNNPWDYNNNSQVFKWLLNKVQDLNGNYMTLSYVSDQGVTYLNRIDYTYNNGGLNSNSLQFTRTGSLLSKIDVYAGTQLARRYSFSYATSSNTGRSLLRSITRYGSDGPSALPDITFSYQTSSGGFATPVSGPLIGANSVAGDFDGDGMADIADASNVKSNNLTSVYYSQGNSFSQPLTLSTPVPSCIAYIPGYGYVNETTISNVLAGDFNSDGTTDLVISGNAPGYCAAFYDVYYSSYSNGQVSFLQNTLPFSTSLSGDFNGDGNTDFVGHQHIDPYTAKITAYDVSITQPDGTFMTSTWALSQEVIQCNYYAMGDFTGDGKTDILVYGCADSQAKVLLSTGGSFLVYELTRDFTFATVVGDFDGDGTADIASVSGSGANAVTNMYFGKDIFTSPTAWSTPLPSSTYGITIEKLLAADFNGDGKADLLIKGCLNDGFGNCNSPFSKVYYSTGPIPDLLITANNGIGGTTTITYAPSTDYTNEFLPVVTQVVSSITVNDGNGNLSTTNYIYSDGLFSDREFRGFGYVKGQSQNPAGLTTETWYDTDDIYKGLPSAQMISDVPGHVYTVTINTYQTTTPYTRVSFPHLSKKDDYIFDGTVTVQQVYNGTWGSGLFKQASSTFEYDSYGNIKRKHSDGYVTLSGDERDAHTDYYYDTTKWLVSFPSHTWISDSAGIKTAETWFDYDATTGNLTTKTFGLVLNNKYDPANPKIVYSSYRYGNAETITDARGYATTISYYSADNPTYTYPVSKTNYLGHVVSTKYDERFGKPLTETDVNLNSVTYQYDFFGRIKTVTTPDSGTTAAYAWKETSYDGLGRATKTRALGPDSKFIVSETKYNDLGQVARTSLPYFTDSQGTPLETKRWAQYLYDPVNRVTEVQSPDNTFVTKDYMQGRTTLTDANGHQKIDEKDVYGRLVKVEEYTGDEAHANFTLYAATAYQYDVLDNLLKVTDAKANQTTMHYDPLSRKKDMNDPDMGYWTYSYDANGNLVSQTDAKGQKIYFQYDAINRMRQKDYVTQKALGSGDVVYKYDETFSTYPKGRLTTVTDASGTEKYYYDQLGRSTTNMKTVVGDGTNYQINTTYDQLGRTKSIKYPDNETVYYDYDAGGNLISVSNYATFSNFNAFGQAGTINYANGVATTQQYYSTNNRLYSITTNSPTAGLQNLSYVYDNTGNIRTITDSIDGSRTQTFTYDELNRLRSAVSSSYVATLGANTISYQYNEIGNMTLNSRVSATAYTYWKDVYGTKPHAVYTAGSDTYQYDNNGNMTGRAGRTIIYDYDNRAVSIAGAGGTVTSVYDYAGNRVKKIAPSGTTIYIGKLYECTADGCVKYVFAGGTRIASQSSNHTYFYHSDHLGSSSVITDERWNKAQETYYYPFGETRYNSGGATHYKFTGQEEDAETGLYYYGARYYDPVIGRFVSADTVVGNPRNPQDLNRYSYCRNNPLKYVDPTGHFVLGQFLESLFTGIVGGAVFILSGGTAAPIFAGIMAGMAAGATSAALNGGNLGQIVQGAIIGGMMGGLGGGIYSTFGDIGAYAMFAGGAAYATASGGLNGLAYYAGGVMGGIAGAAIGYDLMAPSPGGGQAVDDDPLSFNGKKLTATDASGQEVGSWDAASGKPGLTPLQRGGSIPEGSYSANPAQMQRWNNLPWYQQVLAMVGRGEWPGGPAVWGYERVQIDGTFIGRGDGFFIHGGWLTNTTAGCIKILNGLNDGFFNYFSAQQGSMPLTVKYGH